MIKKILAYLPCYFFYGISRGVHKILAGIPAGDEHHTVAMFWLNAYCGVALVSMWFDSFGGLGLWDGFTVT